jgi:hypothetical protein
VGPEKASIALMFDLILFAAERMVDCSINLYKSRQARGCTFTIAVILVQQIKQL